MKALVTTLGLATLIVVVLIGGGALFATIAEANAASADTVMTCQQLDVRVIPSGEEVTLVNNGNGTVNGTLTVERDEVVVATIAVPTLPPGEPIPVAVPQGETAIFAPHSCNRTFAASLG